MTIDLQRKTIAQSALATLVNESSGFNLSELDPNTSFPELGFDSLFLVQFTQNVKSRLKVKLTFRQLLEEVPNIAALIDYIAKNLPENQVEVLAGNTSVAASASAPAPTAQTETVTTPSKIGPATDSQNKSLNESPSPYPSSTLPVPAQPESMAPASVIIPAQPNQGQTMDSQQAASAPRMPVFAMTPHPANPAGTCSSKDGLAEIIFQQNQLMSMQLYLLAGLAPPQSSETNVLANEGNVVDTSDQQTLSQPVQASTTAAIEQVATSSNSLPSTPVGQAASEQTTVKKSFDRFGPFKPVRRALGGGLTEQQQKYLDHLINRFTKRTAKSREHAQRHRTHFADPRGVAGYRRIWKSMVYQISVDRSQGSKLWDIDGNEYIDIAMGFGLNLFGQSPSFVTAALQHQLEKGVEVGPQSPLAGEVAQLLCDFSRKDRATFCNTGSEAVMAAMRLARTVTGKNLIVFFNKDYHGNFDQVLVRSTIIGQQRRSQPAAPGVPQGLADQAIVLDYGTDEALRVLQERADEIAAVLVEPVQSADPFLQPIEFLQEVRRITQENDIALVMDEVITGFRAAPGGAQEWFRVWGDMATYGKILGGGLPIGALTGSHRFMDALDGGDWRYEDNSEPEADMTFFAGTFVRHPLAMTAAYQILMKIKEEGPELQQQLTERTSYLANQLNSFFETELYPIRVAQFTSLFRFMFPPNVEYADLLYFHLLDRGIFTRGWGDNCFLSTAHSNEDIEKIIAAVKDSCCEIREGGFMPRPDDADLEEDRGSLVANSIQSNLEPALPIASSPQAIGQLANPDSTTPSHTSVRSMTSVKSMSRLSTLEEIRGEGNKAPLFCMPAADGLTLVFHELAERLGDDQPVYGLNSPGAYGEQVPYTIEEMAARFIEDIREEFPHGPYALIGYCSGGTIAFEAAQQLVGAGEEVTFLCGIETYDWGTAQSSKPTRWVTIYYEVQRMEFHFRNFFLLNWAHQRAYLKSKWRRLISRTAIWKGMFMSLFSKHKGTRRANASQVNWNEVWRAHDAQADRYVPKTYSGKLLLVRPRKDYTSYVGKSDLQAAGGVEVVRIDAFPTGLMSAPFVDQLAELIDARLADANVSSSSARFASQAIVGLSSKGASSVSSENITTGENGYLMPVR